MRALGPELGRRELLKSGGILLATVAFPFRGARAEGGFRVPAATTRVLGKSPLVYVSPLKSDGAESRCHGEVWYFLDGGDVVLATATDAWKSRALRLGLDRARIWVGDYGPASSADGRFRVGPSFLAEASIDADPATFERLLADFGRKYPASWEKWEPRFRSGYGDGSRRVIRYRPIGA
ncbi:MAG: hypothetical protein VX614_07610 [Myxococcota bacterium]|nr:hypothetical protein [Myxococcota bacterium]